MFSQFLPFQILSGLEIIIPLHTLFAMFKLGVKHLQLIEPDLEDHSPREPSNLSRASPTGDIPPPLSPNKEDPVVVESYEIYKRETEIILPCYIMMLDLALKQVSCSAFFIAQFNEVQRESIRVTILLVGWLVGGWIGLSVYVKMCLSVSVMFVEQTPSRVSYWILMKLENCDQNQV